MGLRWSPVEDTPRQATNLSYPRWTSLAWVMRAVRLGSRRETNITPARRRGGLSGVRPALPR